MPDTRTPGEVAYAGFWHTPGCDFRKEWPTLPASTKARWEAAAQAVLASWLQEQGWLGNTAWLVKLRERGETHPLPAGEEEPRDA
jgi:hypothetical protein